ncbi:hypothetical protein [Microbacterium karelineae]|uniref:hypothetical protein n=1 Tax=Microbacterium karelineae TaxID=2654283 RepID=UPI0012EA4CBA|nr:hypothetical protein [Microbacterium karelineae]
MRRRRGIGIAALGVMVLSAALGGSSAHQTDAAFTDVERTVSAQALGTVVLQPATITSTSCQRPSILNLAQPFLTVMWRWPQGTAPYSGFTAANTRWRIDGTVANASTTGPNASGVYTTTFTGGVLQQILGSLSDLLLGSSFTVTARTVWTPGTSEWQSPQTKTIAVRIPPLAGIQCPNPDA